MSVAVGPSDLLRAAAHRDPDRPALVDATIDPDATTPRAPGRWTWAELDLRVTGAAHALLDTGLNVGDRVALQLPTGADFVTLYLAVLRAGLVAVPVNPHYTAPEVEHILLDSRSALHLDPVAGRELIDASTSGADPHRDRAGEQLAALLYTSGTSGQAKGAMLSARALLANVDQLAAVRPALLTRADVLFVPLPLTHVFGLNAGLGMALRVGATLVVADHFSAAETLVTMAAERVTAVLGVPGQYAAWLAHPAMPEAFGTVRFAMSGATTLPPDVVDGFAAAGVTVHDGYGLTETAPVVTINALDAGRHAPQPGSVGRPLPGVEVELRDVDGDLVDEGDPGRIVVRGENLFSGYWPDGRDGPDQDGWFATGDIAVADAGGELRLVGRSSDLVIVNGFNVHPAEVEAALAQQDGVGEVAVVGVADPVTGEALRAYVVPTAGARLDADALLAAARGSLARFKLPGRVEVVAALPHTVTGKIRKWQLGRDDADAAG